MFQSGSAATASSRREDEPESEIMGENMDNQIGNSCSTALSETAEPFIFVIDCTDPQAIRSADSEIARPSIVVRIEQEDVDITLSPTEPERVTRTLAEALAQETALLAIEKDFPNGVELSLTATQIDQIPAEFENRLPNLCVNRTDAWLVYPQKDQ